MKGFIIAGIIAFGVYYFFTAKPSTESIVSSMSFGEQVMYKDQTYRSDWSDNAETIEGYIRRKDRHYDENIPVITYTLVITTGEYSDPDIVSVKSRGKGNYYWSSKKQPEGSIIFYHTVPDSAVAQTRLDGLREGDTVKIVARVSKNGEIKADNGAYVKLMHGNHKFILVEDAL